MREYFSPSAPCLCTLPPLQSARKGQDSGDELPGLLPEAESGEEPDSQEQEDGDEEPVAYGDSRQQPGDYPYSDEEDETAGKHAKKKAGRTSGLKAGAPWVPAACSAISAIIWG